MFCAFRMRDLREIDITRMQPMYISFHTAIKKSCEWNVHWQKMDQNVRSAFGAHRLHRSSVSFCRHSIIEPCLSSHCTVFTAQRSIGGVMRCIQLLKKGVHTVFALAQTHFPHPSNYHSHIKNKKKKNNSNQQMGFRFFCLSVCLFVVFVHTKREPRDRSHSRILHVSSRIRATTVFLNTHTHTHQFTRTQNEITISYIVIDNDNKRLFYYLRFHNIHRLLYTLCATHSLHICNALLHYRGRMHFFAGRLRFFCQ